MSANSDQQAALRITSGRKPFVEPLRLGERLKEIRLAQGWTLEDVSRRTGVARSTLSKIENHQVSPTFTVVQKLITGLGIDLPQLFTPPRQKSHTMGRRDLTRRGEGEHHPTPTYEHELLSCELAQKRMVPFKTIVRARSFDEFSEWEIGRASWRERVEEWMERGGTGSRGAWTGGECDRQRAR